MIMNGYSSITDSNLFKTIPSLKFKTDELTDYLFYVEEVIPVTMKVEQQEAKTRDKRM